MPETNLARDIGASRRKIALFYAFLIAATVSGFLIIRSFGESLVPPPGTIWFTEAVARKAGRITFP